MISRKFIIIALIILGVLYFGLNFFGQQTDNQMVMEKTKSIESSKTEGQI
jgi:hypothetical protein